MNVDQNRSPISGVDRTGTQPVSVLTDPTSANLGTVPAVGLFEMVKRKFSDLAKGGSRNLLIAVNEALGLLLGLISLLFVIPQLGTEVFGGYSALYGITGPIASFSTIGLVMLTLESVLQDGEKARRVMQSCFGILTIAMLVGVPLALFLVHDSIHNVPFKIAAMVVGTELVINSATSIVSGLLQVAKSFAHGVGVRIAQNVSRLLVILTLLLSGSFTLSRLVVWQLVGAFVVLLVAVIYVQRTTVGHLSVRRPLPGHPRSLVLYSLGIAGAQVQNDSDKVFLQRSKLFLDGGLYAVAYRLATLVVLPMSVLATSTHFATLENSRTQRHPARQALAYSKAALKYALPCAFMGEFAAFLIPTLRAEYRPAIIITQLLIPILVIRGLTTFPMNGLIGIARNDIRTRLLVGFAILAVLLYAVVIPRYSWRGAVGASAFLEVMQCLTTWAVFLVIAKRLRRPRHALQTPPRSTSKQHLRSKTHP
jgi:O-antigen/teichoic acid export membrane protein